MQSCDRIPLHAGGRSALLKGLRAALRAARRRAAELRRATPGGDDLAQAEEELRKLEEERRNAERNGDSFLF